MTNRLLPLKELDYRAAAAEHFSDRVHSVQDATRQISDVIDAAMTVATEMMWPILLKAARSLRNGPVEVGGWRLRSVKGKDSHDTTFVMESKDGKGGYVLNLLLRPVMTEEALRQLKAVTEPIRQRIMNLEDETERRKQMATWLLNPTAEELAVRNNPGSYRHPDDCSTVSEFVCCAYRTEAGRPIGYNVRDCYIEGLEATIATGFDGYQSGKIFAYRPSWKVVRGEDPEFGTSAGISDGCASIFVMQKLSEAMFQMGFSGEIDDRTEALGNLRYRYFCDDRRSPLKALGAGAVFRDGGHVGEITYSALHSFVGRSAAVDVTKRAAMIVELADYLEADGRTSADKEYECNDADDWGHVVRREDGSRSLFIRTQHNQYRIDLGDVAENGQLEAVTLAMIHKGQFGASMPEPGERGFLGHFAQTNEGVFQAYESVPFESNHLRAFNDLAFTVESMHCCWEEEHGDEDEPSVP